MWVDPRYEQTTLTYLNARRVVAGTGARPCKNCRGLRFKILTHAGAKAPIKVPCMACNQ